MAEREINLGRVVGSDGKSAYQTWLDEGNVGDESAFLESLRGEQGIQGIQGEQGVQGEKGDGLDYSTMTPEEIANVTGKSAYEVAVDSGFVGTESEWLASLKGEKGEQGVLGIQGEKGEQGVQGEKGDTGETNLDVFEIVVNQSLWEEDSALSVYSCKVLDTRFVDDSVIIFSPKSFVDRSAMEACGFFDFAEAEPGEFTLHSKELPPLLNFIVTVIN